MIQATGLTSNPRRGLPPAVDDVSFEARAGRVTALLGRTDAGMSVVLRLMLELQPGRGVTYFRGRPLHRIAHPAREVGVLLGEVPGHPGRSVRGQLRMLCAAAGVPVSRADEVLEVVGLVSLRDQRLGTLSRGMDRRLGLACALLADPHTLVLDSPADGLSAREGGWVHTMLRAHADQGGTVLFTTGDAKEAARVADQVVTVEQGKLVADQKAGDFARTRLRPRVAVRSPHAARLGVLLTKEARAGKRSLEVVREDGNRLSVYGSNCAEVGETAFRHGVLIHQLADEEGDLVPTKPSLSRASSSGSGSAELASRPEPSTPPSPAIPSIPSRPSSPREAYLGRSADVSRGGAAVESITEAHVPDATPTTALRRVRRLAAVTTRASRKELPLLPPPITARPARSPLRPLRYEVRRAAGIRTGYVTAFLVVAVSTVMALYLARAGHTPLPRLLAAWPYELPLAPAAMGAGLLGALSFGDEFRHPALAADRGSVPRRLGLLVAKLVVCAGTAVLLAVATVVTDGLVLHVVYGEEVTRLPVDWPDMAASWLALSVACSWAGLLAAGVFRSTTAGLAALLAVPVVLVPVVEKLLAEPSARSAVGLPGRLREVTLVQWPAKGDRFIAGLVHMIAQPVGSALVLSLAALLCAYLLTGLRSRAR
ncbi:ATP-binding cassette domain-containing protein [Streptomyces sp. LHD-70]|uniref:ATP-binding cassette domain-containing protein n=1 Tax=Streptomyces sp. LHD-70 TaxID=3072140 RepID=UPI0028106CEE|nr:ATP-binding cassette domain-containing protein [Streptomyces sp. LHD-70]MDQ8703497.1 ATP-binding cassette domain-containing protein [Streptomyces sp. LHD-70]